MPKPDVETLAAEYRAGASLRELARRHNHAVSTVALALETHGVQLRNTGHGGRRNVPEPAAPDAIVAAYTSGLTVNEVARKLETSRVEVVRVLRLRNVPIPHPRKPPAQTIFEQVAADYARGLTIQQLAERYGVTDRAIRYRLNRMGVERRPRARRPTKGTPTAVLVAEYQAGATAAEIGRKHGISGPAVAKRLRRAGVQMRVPNLKPVSTDDLAADYATGLSIARVAAIHGLSEATVRERFKKANVPTRSHTP